MKKFLSHFLLPSVGLCLAVTVPSCTSSSSEETELLHDVITQDAFESCRQGFKVYTNGVLYIMPQTLVVSTDNSLTADASVCDGVIYTAAGTTLIDVSLTYETEGELVAGGPPTRGTVKVSFNDPGGVDDEGILTALGFTSTELEGDTSIKLSDWEFVFDFTTGYMSSTALGSDFPVVDAGTGNGSDSVTAPGEVVARFSVVSNTGQ